MHPIQIVVASSVLAILACGSVAAKDKPEKQGASRTQPSTYSREDDRRNDQVRPARVDNVDPAHDDVRRDHSRAKEPWLNVDVRFSGREREIICDHVRYQDATPTPVHYQKGSKSKPLPPGLAKKVQRGGTLPPGWQKKVAVGQTMEKEIYCQAKPLPREVAVKLPPPPKGTVVVVVQGKVVRLIEATLEILDVFEIGPQHRGS